MPRHVLSVLLLVLPLPAAAQTAPAPAAGDAVQVAADTLDGYTGRYRTAGGIVLHVWRAGEHLKLQVDGQDEWTLLADSESTYRVQGQDARVAFKYDAANRVGVLELSQGGSTFRAVRE
ncbi:MAG: hypothetical protein QM601_03860 [Pseudoxanthomonas sp.]